MIDGKWSMIWPLTALGIKRIGDEFGGPYGFAHFACDEFEEGQIQARVTERFASGSSPLFLDGQNFEEQEVVGTVLRLLAFPSKLVSEGDQGDRGDRIPVAAVVAERDVHRACPLKNVFRRSFSPVSRQNSVASHWKVLLADQGNDVCRVF